MIRKRSIILSTLIFGVCAPLFGCFQEKDRLDAEARLLCANDGGIRVHQKIFLPHEMFDEFGVVKFQGATLQNRLGSEYAYIRETEFLEKGDPSLRKEYVRLIRKSDGYVLGESTTYHRVGGDMPGPWHPSSFVCPENSGTPFLEKEIFLMKN